MSVSAIEAVCRILDLPIIPPLAEKLAAYAEEICRWNRRVNLTGAKSVSQFIEGPLFDALTVRPVMAPADTLVDVGSGGGLPGVPIALLEPGIAVTLVEPRGRRAAFLRHIAHHLDLDLEIMECRAEALPPRRWHSAVSQAVWEPGEWIGRARALVSPGGFAYVLSSRDISDTDIHDIQARYHCAHPSRPVSRFSFRLVV